MIEIYFDDLVPETQERLLRNVNAKSAEEMNWDVFPLGYVDLPEELQNDETEKENTDTIRMVGDPDKPWE